MSAVLPAHILSNQSHLKQTFSKYDIDGSGTITTDELRQGLIGDKKQDPMQFKRMISEINPKNEGELTFSEFT